MLFKEGKGKANRFLYRFIGIENSTPHGIVEQTDRQAKAKLPLLRFGQFPSLQAATQPMKLCLAHGPLKAQQQTIIVGSWIINPFLIDHKGMRESTDFQQLIPIAAGTCQTRDLQAQNSSDVT